MAEHGVRGPEIAQAALAQPQAEIDVVEIDGEALVEPADLVPMRPRHREASGGDGGELMDETQPAEMIAMIGRQPPVEMPGIAAGADDDAGMLDRAVGIEQLGADRADTGLDRLDRQRLKPGTAPARKCRC